MAKSRGREEPGLVGYLGFLIILAILAYSIHAGYTAYLNHRPVIVSLSAHFVDGSSSPARFQDASGKHLEIRGEVYQAGKQLREGQVRLTVSMENRTFSQSVSVDLKNGQFESDDPAFQSLRPDDPLYITAEVSSPQLSDMVSQRLYSA